MPSKLWADVTVGDYVRGKDGHQWCVTEHRHQRNSTGDLWVVTVERDGREPYSFTATHAPVEVLGRVAPGDPMEHAIAAVQVRLGANLMAHREAPGQPWRVPTKFDLPSLLSHLYVLHGQNTTDSPTYEELAERHRTSHDGSHPPEYEEHVHDPEVRP